MFIALVAPYDDSIWPDAWIVESDPADKWKFEAQYEAALEEAEKANPEEWNIKEVLAILKKSGWPIQSIGHNAHPQLLELTY